MPVYQYQALDLRGKKSSGVIEGHSEREAKEKLRFQGVMVTKLEAKSGKLSRNNLEGENLVSFTLQFSQLVNAGVPLYESLVAIEEQYQGEKFHRIILSLCEQIKSGKPLSEALAGFPDSFDRLYCAMIRAGESSGALDRVLDRLAEFLAKRNKLKKQIVTAMIYPSILAGFSFLIILLLLTFVIPSIEEIFKDMELNRFTEIILSVSHFFQDYWWAYIPLTIGVIGFAVYQLRTAAGNIWRQRIILKIPVIRNFVVQASVARFCRTMGTLQVGGLTMIDSLRIAREVMGNVVLEEEVSKAEGKIVEGSSLSKELSKSKLIPRMVSRMLAVGEESGTTSVIFNKVADFYEDELEKSLERVVALAQPIILLFMGVVIGTVLLAILLPLTDVSSFTM